MSVVTNWLRSAFSWSRCWLFHLIQAKAMATFLRAVPKITSLKQKETCWKNTAFQAQLKVQVAAHDNFWYIYISYEIQKHRLIISIFIWIMVLLKVLTAMPYQIIMAWQYCTLKLYIQWQCWTSVCSKKLECKISKHCYICTAHQINPDCGNFIFSVVPLVFQ